MKTKVFVLVALVTGVVSTGYARQDFLELIEKRAETAAQRAQAQRAPAQANQDQVKKSPEAQFERSTARKQ